MNTRGELVGRGLANPPLEAGRQAEDSQSWKAGRAGVRGVGGGGGRGGQTPSQRQHPLPNCEQASSC